MLGLLLLLLAGACAGETSSPSGRAPAASAPALDPREVETARAELSPWERSLHAVGSLAAFEEATIATKVPGRLVELRVDLGAPIRAGEVVARIDRRDYELAVARAEAALGRTRAALGLPAQGDDDRVDPEATAAVREARAVLAERASNRDRVQTLSGSGVASQASRDEAESTFRVAESRLQDALEGVLALQAALVERRAELAIARAALADTDVLAPFDGATLERLAGTGDFLSAGDPIARVARLDPLRLRLSIPERESSKVRVGQPVRLLLEGSDGVHAGAIVRISPEVGARNRALVVEAEVANTAPSAAVGINGEAPPGGDGGDGGDVRLERGSRGLRPGAFARAEIVVDPAARAVVVPPAALTTFAGLDKVIVIEDGKATERRVSIGRRDERRVEVLSGLEPGEEVVLSPGSLQAGTPVRSR